MNLDTNIAIFVADISFSGKIKEYKINPIAIQNNETAAKNRLTISVEITYVNNMDNSKNFNQIFTDYTDFDSTQNFYEEELELGGPQGVPHVPMAAMAGAKAQMSLHCTASYTSTW